MLRDHLLRRGLSNREAEVAAEVAKGMSNREVADRLFVTEKTIKFHLTSIYKKLSIKSRSQLIVWCAPHLTFIEEKEPPKDEDIPEGVRKLPTPNNNY